MTNIDQFRKTINDRMLSEWTGTPADRIVFENEAGFADTAPWVRVVCRHTSSRQRTLGKQQGSKRIQHNGDVVIHVFNLADGNGTKPADELGQEIKDIFQSQTLLAPDGRSVWLFAAQPAELETNGTLTQLEVSIPFHYEEYN